MNSRALVPQTIKVGPHTVRVLFSHEECNQPDYAVFGCFKIQDLEIVLDPQQGDTMLLDTFMYEVIEAINGIYGLELPHPTIQTLGVALSQVLSSAEYGGDT